MTSSARPPSAPDPRRPLAALAALAIACAPGVARAGDGAADDAPTDFWSRLWREATARLEAASEARRPPLEPPVPVPVSWRARRLGAVDLGGPLLALTAGDLDGDERAELIAVTDAELVVLARAAGAVSIVARAALPADPAVMWPRDPVGAVSLTTDPGGQVRIAARASGRARGGVYTWRDGALVEIAQHEGFALCGHVSAELAAGRNHFDAATLRVDSGELPAAPAQFHVARCRTLRDPAGRPLAVTAFAAVDGTLALTSQPRCREGDDGCRAGPSEQLLPDLGVAFDVGDLDNDGVPEVVATTDRPPGEPDRVAVLSLTGAAPRALFRRGFSGGVVGVAVADFDADRAVEVVTAVRLLGSSRVDLWELNR